MLEHDTDDGIPGTADRHDDYDGGWALSRRQRLVLDVLDELETTETTLGELASTVDRIERRRWPDQSFSKQRLLVGLHHFTLPGLDHAGLVEYHSASKRVVRRPQQSMD